MKPSRLSSAQAGFDAALAELTRYESAQDAAVEAAVRAIIDDVRRRGDAAVLEYTNRFDRMSAPSIETLDVPAAELSTALAGLPAEQREALSAAADRVRSFHERQKAESWEYREADGTVLGQRVTPLDRVGLYVPGGKAAYPSSVLMNAVPARVAGVGEIVMVCPTPDGRSVWQFRCRGAALAVEDSLWIDGEGIPHGTQQLVLTGIAPPGGAGIGWRFHRAR